MNSSALDKIRTKLKPTVTRVTSADGKVHHESGGVVTDQDVEVNGPGYVVDMAPDLTLSQILPWLFMSSQDVAADQKILRQSNITNVLNVGVGIDIVRDEDIEEKKVELLDIPEQSIDDALTECCKYLTWCQNLNKNVLVHCNAGVSRSATVVIGYLMKCCQFSYQEALDFVKDKRPCIRPNDGFVKQLKNISRI